MYVCMYVCIGVYKYIYIQGGPLPIINGLTTPLV